MTSKALTEEQYAPIRSALFDHHNGSATEAMQRVGDALADAGWVLIRAEPDHFVTFDADGWFIEHSVACRVAGTLGTCEYNQAIRKVYDEPPVTSGFGRWRITEIDSEGLPSLERAVSA